MKLAYQFKNVELLQRALTHPSMSKDGTTQSYEKLEFLGDNVVNLIVAKALFLEYPHEKEGKLSQMHSNLVRTEMLSHIAREIGLSSAMILDKGEVKTGGRNNDNNLENCFEALVGAVFLDSNYQICEQVFTPLFIEHVKLAAEAKRDPKTLLQEWSQKNKLGLPVYQTIAEDGLSHEKLFTVSVTIPGYEPTIGTSNAVKKAQAAAAQAFLKSNGLI